MITYPRLNHLGQHDSHVGLHVYIGLAVGLHVYIGLAGGLLVQVYIGLAGGLLVLVYIGLAVGLLVYIGLAVGLHVYTQFNYTSLNINVTINTIVNRSVTNRASHRLCWRYRSQNMINIKNSTVYFS